MQSPILGPVVMEFRTTPYPPDYANFARLVSSRVGSGSPQNLVAASPGSDYADSTNGDKWIKHTGTGSSGWQQLAAA